MRIVSRGDCLSRHPFINWSAPSMVLYHWFTYPIFHQGNKIGFIAGFDNLIVFPVSHLF